MNTTTFKRHFRLTCLDQQFTDPLILQRKKNLFGSSEKCDVHLSHKSISPVHAFFFITEGGVEVIDLFSETGVFVNGMRTERATLCPGDTFTLGTLSFFLDFFDVASSFCDDAALTLPDSPPPFEEVLASNGYVFIDGEFLDITFDDSKFTPLADYPQTQSCSNYFDLDQSQTPLPISHKIMDKRLEVITYISGIVMDVSYIELTDGDYFLNSTKESRFDLVFYSIMKTKIFSIKNGELKIYSNPDLSPSVPWGSVNLSEPLFLTSGVEQISLRLINESLKFSEIPLLYRDRDFIKQGAKIFFSLFLPILLLLLVDVPQNIEKKNEIAVIYKLSLPKDLVITSEMNLSQASDQLIADALSSDPKDSKRIIEKPEKFPPRVQTQKTISTASTHKDNPNDGKTLKSYEFSSNISVSSIVGDTPQIMVNESSSKNGTSATDFDPGKSDSKNLVASKEIGVSKFNGEESKATKTASYGSRGLSSKSSFDSSYIAPKTVVLGSMDPDLLRKILQEHIPQFRHCYQQELIAHSDKIKGILDLNFTIDPNGRVSKYEIKLKDAAFSKKGIGCMGQVLGVIDFPKPRGGGSVDVRQPLNFFSI
jgi:hypothetical protein